MKVTSGASAAISREVCCGWNSSLPIATNIGTSIAATSLPRRRHDELTVPHVAAERGPVLGGRPPDGHRPARPTHVSNIVVEQLPVARRRRRPAAAARPTREPFGHRRVSSADDVRAADAHPEHVAALDAELVEQRQLVGAVGRPPVRSPTPAPSDGRRCVGPCRSTCSPSASASLGFHGMSCPEVVGRPHPAGSDQQHREAVGVAFEVVVDVRRRRG